MKNYLDFDIVIFCDFPSPYRVEVFKGLAKKYRCIVFFDRCSDQSRDSDWFVSYAELHAYSLLNKEGKKMFSKILKNITNFKLVIAYDYHIRHAVILQMVCIKNHVPYFMNLDGGFIRKKSFKDVIKKYLIKHASGFFANGKSAEDYFIHYGGKPENIYHHNFSSMHECEFPQNNTSNIEKQSIKKELGICASHIFLSIGQFIKRKGFIYLLKAWKQMPSDDILILIGGGPEKKKYMDYINKHKIENIIILDYMSFDELKKYYCVSDCFILPTLEDIWGLVITEAMSFGLPIITTSMCIAGVELIQSSDVGIIVPVEDSESLLNAMRYLVDNYDSFNKEKIKNIVKNHTYENVVDSHIKSIDSFFGGKYENYKV